jgi:head-tail adaptor
VDVGKLKNKIQVFGKVPFTNELGEDDTHYDLLKTVWSQILPTFSGANGKNEIVDTAETTHKIKCRKSSLTPTIDMYFKYDGLRYDVKYFQPDFRYKEFWEIMVKVTYE